MDEGTCCKMKNTLSSANYDEYFNSHHDFILPTHPHVPLLAVFLLMIMMKNNERGEKPESGGK